jgi:hypothetical protein
MAIVDEILALSDADEMIHPARLIEWARENPDSELHGQFEWDDSKAAHEYRLHQARRLIAVHVIDDSGDRRVISLVTDRSRGGGYRDLQTVLSNAEMRRIALRQALGEFNRIRAKYEHLRELASIHEAIVATDQAISRSEVAAEALPLAADRA